MSTATKCFGTPSNTTIENTENMKQTLYDTLPLEDLVLTGNGKKKKKKRIMTGHIH